MNKQAAFNVTISILLLFSCSTGFDLYAHTTIYYYYNNPYIHNTYSIMDTVFFPRYILLSSIFELFSRLGVPIGIVIITLMSIPLYRIYFSIEKKSKRTTYNVYEITMITVLYYLSFQYSGLSLVIIFFSAFILSKNKMYLIGGFFHPVGIIISVMALIFFERKQLILFFILVFIVFGLYAIFSNYDFSSTIVKSNTKYNIDLYTIHDLLNRSYESKRFLLYVPLVAYLVSKLNAITKRIKSMKLMINMITLRKKMINIASIVIFVSLTTYMSFFKPNPNLFYSIITANINDVMYISWFDWGSADVSQSYYSILEERYSGNLDD